MKPDAFPYIIEPLRSFAVDLSTLTVDPNNTRKHNARSIDGVKRSLQKFGQRLPIIVQKQGLLVRVGNGRVLAARQLGWTHIAALVVDESEADALQYAIADNRTGELSDWDYESLANQLKSLSTGLSDFQYEDLGFTKFEMQDVLSKLEQSATTIALEEEEDLESKVAPAKFASVDENIKTEHVCPKCGFRYSGGGSVTSVVDSDADFS